ncbi:MAG: hypothetical protein BWY93_00273 [Euryarchaeota archaeon ADurb.BinA087]|nr:MAG: hypothetical protein BWY93_00273 [Euryarchaeota archaeon ADurb.BinA087]HPX73660.1 hypothetical protein [Methanoregulaceae archaeon]HQA79972.1 hypothetical protein [Methanoregulaceae archaeon]
MKPNMIKLPRSRVELPIRSYHENNDKPDFFDEDHENREAAPCAA